VDFEEWKARVPTEITKDALWRVTAYQLATYLADVCWVDVTRLMQDRRTISLSDQLYRAIGSVGANLAEGYSIGTVPNRARFYEYSLGSAREARDWYFKARHVLDADVVLARLALLERIIQLLLAAIPQQRALRVREDDAKYFVDHNDGFAEQ